MSNGELFPYSEEGVEQSKPHDRFEAEDKELEEALGHIWEIAHEHKLDPFPTHFEVVPPHIINELGSYGIPGRFSHWTHGQQYRQTKTQYDYGMSKIYELVINSNPSQAYLLENNPPIENKFVMAHVLGHTDFFKNNQMFAKTRRDMPEAAARSSERIHDYEDKVGRLTVEKTLDATLAIEEYVDPYHPQRPSRAEELGKWREEAIRKYKPLPKAASEFDDLFFRSESAESKAANESQDGPVFKIPPAPDSDILGFIRNHAPYLDEWQRDVVDIVRSESIYFYPQRRTKIMNEGWAAYWHKRIMREMGERDLIPEEENEAWWRVHSGVVQPSEKRLNPYYLGMKMYEYIEDYHNGNLTKEEETWLKKEDIPVPPHYEGELKDSPATPVLREVMELNDDQSFIRNYFNKIVSDRMNLYIYEEKPTFYGMSVKVVKESGWQDIRDMLADSMVNNGNPSIVVEDGDYKNANELYLKHEFEGQTLDPEYIQKTLPYVHTLWQRPVHLETVDDKTEKGIVYTYDGKEVTKKDMK